MPEFFGDTIARAFTAALSPSTPYNLKETAELSGEEQGES